ncbi:MAG: methylmalonyl Co-A mutase-associated GTPase MeaB [Rectinemataceae bacterium]
MTEYPSGSILAGDIRACARLISALENGDEEAYRFLASLNGKTGHAQIIGVTGPPGSGKSTLTDKMIGVLRARGMRVGVVAVDPSSPFSGGAILGDRLRMQGHATDPGVFIRSLASRGKLGGLSEATHAAVTVLDAAGYDVVIIETVGVGQSEIDIVRVADTVLLISVPGLGDDIQVIKAGIMEIGDVFVVNKSDREGSDRVVREIRAMLETQAMLKRGSSVPAGPDTLAFRFEEAAHHRLAPESVTGAGIAHGALRADNTAPDMPPVVKTVAETGEGVEAVVDAVLALHARAVASGELAARRYKSARFRLRDMALKRALKTLADGEGAALTDTLARDIVEGKKDIYGAAGELFAVLSRGGKL